MKLDELNPEGRTARTSYYARLATAGFALACTLVTSGCPQAFVPPPANMPMTVVAEPYHAEDGAAQAKGGVGMGYEGDWEFGGGTLEYALSDALTIQADVSAASARVRERDQNTSGTFWSGAASLRFNPGDVGRYLWVGPTIAVGHGPGGGWVSPELGLGTSLPTRIFTPFISFAAGPRIPIGPEEVDSDERGSPIYPSTALSMRGSTGVFITLATRHNKNPRVSMLFATSLHGDPIFDDTADVLLELGLSQTIGFRFSFGGGDLTSSSKEPDAYP